MPGELRKAQVNRSICNCLRRLAKSSWSRSRSRANSRSSSVAMSGSCVAGGRFCAANRAIPNASIASVLVRCNSSSAKRRVRNGFSTATA